jgi:hypothetical protein
MIKLDTCPGYMDKQGEFGICCCGLHWRGTMPPHDRYGRIFSEKTIERKRKQAERSLKEYVVSESRKLPKQRVQLTALCTVEI